MLLDVLPAGLNGFAHQDGKQGVRCGRVFDRDLLQEPPLGIHGGLPKLLGISPPRPFCSAGGGAPCPGAASPVPRAAVPCTRSGLLPPAESCTGAAGRCTRSPRRSWAACSGRRG